MKLVGNFNNYLGQRSLSKRMRTADGSLRSDVWLMVVCLDYARYSTKVDHTASDSTPSVQGPAASIKDESLSGVMVPEWRECRHHATYVLYVRGCKTRLFPM